MTRKKQNSVILLINGRPGVFREGIGIIRAGSDRRDKPALLKTYPLHEAKRLIRISIKMDQENKLHYFYSTLPIQL